MSIELLKDLHLLTRDGQLNADARRKLKQIRHLVGLLRPALDDALARHDRAAIVDCGAGKSYLGALLYELVLGPAGRGTLTAIEARPELSRAGRRARGAVRPGSLHASRPARSTRVDAAASARTSSPRCTRATPRPTTRSRSRSRSNADHVAVVPCCQAEVARQLETSQPDDPAIAALFAHPLHRRELGSHLTNVIRGLVLEAHGYKVTVTELVGWEHSVKNELILGKRVHRYDADGARARCARCSSGSRSSRRSSASSPRAVSIRAPRRRQRQRSTPTARVRSFARPTSGRRTLSTIARIGRRLDRHGDADVRPASRERHA